MDDDLRNRFRSTRRSYDDVPVRRAPMAPRPAAPQPKPVDNTPDEPVWARQQAASERPHQTVADSKPAAKPKKAKKPRKKRSGRKKVLLALPIMLLAIGGFGAFKFLKKKPAT